MRYRLLVIAISVLLALGMSAALAGTKHRTHRAAARIVPPPTGYLPGPAVPGGPYVRGQARMVDIEL